MNLNYTIWNRIRCSYRKIKHKHPKFNLSKEYLQALFDKQGGKCAISGIPISFADEKEITASLDRKNSNMPYIVGNVWWVHKDINLMKRHHNLKYFRFLCERIADYGRN